MILRHCLRALPGILGDRNLRGKPKDISAWGVYGTKVLLVLKSKKQMLPLEKWRNVRSMQAERSQMGHVWALIKSWSVWLWEDCGVGKEKGKKWKCPQNKQRQGESESQIFITFTSRAIMFTKRGCRRGGGNLSEENFSFYLRIVQFSPTLGQQKRKVMDDSMPNMQQNNEGSSTNSVENWK